MNFLKSTYRPLAILMAFLMFLTSAGITVDFHYCQGKLKTVSFFGKAKSCHDIGEGMKNCPHHKKMMTAKKLENKTKSEKDCCRNKSILFQSDQDHQLQADEAVVANTQLQHFAIAYVKSFLQAIVSETEQPTYAHYKSPHVPRDIYVLLETYLL